MQPLPLLDVRERSTTQRGGSFSGLSLDARGAANNNNTSNGGNGQRGHGAVDAAGPRAGLNNHSSSDVHTATMVRRQGGGESSSSTNVRAATTRSLLSRLRSALEMQELSIRQLRNSAGLPTTQPAGGSTSFDVGAAGPVSHGTGPSNEPPQQQRPTSSRPGASLSVAWDVPSPASTPSPSPPMLDPRHSANLAVVNRSPTPPPPPSHNQQQHGGAAAQPTTKGLNPRSGGGISGAASSCNTAVSGMPASVFHVASPDGRRWGAELQYAVAKATVRHPRDFASQCHVLNAFMEEFESVAVRVAKGFLARFLSDEEAPDSAESPSTSTTKPQPLQQQQEQNQKKGGTDGAGGSASSSSGDREEKRWTCEWATATQLGSGECLTVTVLDCDEKSAAAAASHQQQCRLRLLAHQLSTFGEILVHAAPGCCVYWRGRSLWISADTFYVGDAMTLQQSLDLEAVIESYSEFANLASYGANAGELIAVRNTMSSTAQGAEESTTSIRLMQQPSNSHPTSTADAAANHPHNHAASSSAAPLEDAQEVLLSGHPSLTVRLGHDGLLYLDRFDTLYPRFPPAATRATGGAASRVGLRHGAGMVLRPETIRRAPVPLSPGAFVVYSADDSIRRNAEVRSHASVTCQEMAKRVAERVMVHVRRARRSVDLRDDEEEGAHHHLPSTAAAAAAHGVLSHSPTQPLSPRVPPLPLSPRRGSADHHYFNAPAAAPSTSSNRRGSGGSSSQPFAPPDAHDVLFMDCVSSEEPGWAQVRHERRFLSLERLMHAHGLNVGLMALVLHHLRSGEEGGHHHPHRSLLHRHTSGSDSSSSYHYYSSGSGSDGGMDSDSVSLPEDHSSAANGTARTQAPSEQSSHADDAAGGTRRPHRHRHDAAAASPHRRQLRHAAFRIVFSEMLCRVARDYVRFCMSRKMDTEDTITVIRDFCTELSNRAMFDALWQDELFGRMGNKFAAYHTFFADHATTSPFDAMDGEYITQRLSHMLGVTFASGVVLREGLSAFHFSIKNAVPTVKRLRFVVRSLASLVSITASEEFFIAAGRPPVNSPRTMGKDSAKSDAPTAAEVLQPSSAAVPPPAAPPPTQGGGRRNSSGGTVVSLVGASPPHNVTDSKGRSAHLTNSASTTSFGLYARLLAELQRDQLQQRQQQQQNSSCSFAVPSSSSSFSLKQGNDQLGESRQLERFVRLYLQTVLKECRDRHRPGTSMLAHIAPSSTSAGKRTPQPSSTTAAVRRRSQQPSPSTSLTSSSSAFYNGRADEEAQLPSLSGYAALSARYLVALAQCSALLIQQILPLTVSEEAKERVLRLAATCAECAVEGLQRRGLLHSFSTATAAPADQQNGGASVMKSPVLRSYVGRSGAVVLYDDQLQHGSAGNTAFQEDIGSLGVQVRSLCAHGDVLEKLGFYNGAVLALDHALQVCTNAFVRMPTTPRNWGASSSFRSLVSSAECEPLVPPPSAVSGGAAGPPVFLPVSTATSLSQGPIGAGGSRLSARGSRRRSSSTALVGGGNNSQLGMASSELMDDDGPPGQSHNAASGSLQRLETLRGAAVATKLANLMEEHQQHREAEALFRYSLMSVRKVYGTFHEAVSVAITDLAVNLYQQGHTDEVESLYREDLIICETLWGKTDLRVASTYNNLACLLDRLGRTEESEPLYRQDLETTIAALGETHADVAVAQNNLAAHYIARFNSSHDASLLALAVPLLQSALTTRRTLFGPFSLPVAEILMNSGQLARLQQNMDQAKSFWQEALGVLEAVHGPLSMKLLGVLRLLTLAAEEVCDYVLSEECMDRTLQIKQAEADKR